MVRWTQSIINTMYNIGPEEYVFDHEDFCMSVFFGNDFPPPGGPFAVLGTVFLRKWYSLFDSMSVPTRSVSRGRSSGIMLVRRDLGRDCILEPHGKHGWNRFWHWSSTSHPLTIK